MIAPPTWLALLLALALLALAALLAVWWRQQTYRWPLVVVACLVGASLLSWWSGLAFQVADYRAGCDGLCPGFRGAPVRFFLGQTAGNTFLPGLFLVNSLIYVVLLLGWSAAMRAVLVGLNATGRAAAWKLALVAALLLVAPFAFSPLYLPPPEAHVRGDPQRVAINAQREVYLYDHLAPAPVLRVGLEDVRPRRDGEPGLRVCLRAYTYFYLPTGHMYLDMGAEGVHSNRGGVVPLGQSCWD